MFQGRIRLRPLAASLRRRPWLLLSLAPLVLLLGSIGSRRPGLDAGRLSLTVLDVGQGDCLVLRTPGGRTVLIDGGGANDEAEAAASDVGDRTVLPYLRYEGINRIDVLVVTHPHGDHVGGLSAVLREEPVGVVLDGTRVPCKVSA